MSEEDTQNEDRKDRKTWEGVQTLPLGDALREIAQKDREDLARLRFGTRNPPGLYFWAFVLRNFPLDEAELNELRENYNGEGFELWTGNKKGQGWGKFFCMFYRAVMDSDANFFATIAKGIELQQRDLKPERLAVYLARSAINTYREQFERDPTKMDIREHVEEILRTMNGFGEDNLNWPRIWKEIGEDLPSAKPGPSS